MLFEITAGTPFLQGSAPITKEEISEMVKTYRNKHRGNDVLHYAHFSLSSIIDFLIANDALDAKAKATIKKSVNGNEIGVKIYMGTHPATYGTRNCRYKDTSILCNTEIIKDNEYRDILVKSEEKPAYVIIGTNFGQGLDQAEICPPSCSPIDDENYDIYYQP